MKRYELPIHFGNDNGRHEINAESLVVFIDSYQDIFEELTGSSVTIEIGIPEEGGWKTNLAILGAAISFIGIDNLSILIRGKPSADLFYVANHHIVEFITTEASQTSEEYPRKCIERKNKIYEQFKKDDCIDSFDVGELAPIQKRNFDSYIKKLPDEDNVYLGTTQITVSSPDWKGKRSWRGKIDIIEDEETAFDFDKDLTGKFWEKVKLDALSLKTEDTMIVQLVYRPNNKVKYRVIRVINYNNADIDGALSDEEVAKVASVKGHKSAVTDNKQPDLFDFIEESKK